MLTWACIFSELMLMGILRGEIFFWGEGLGYEEKNTPSKMNQNLKEYGEEIYFYLSFQT